MLAHKNFDLSYGRATRPSAPARRRPCSISCSTAPSVQPKEQFPPWYIRPARPWRGEIILSQKTVDRCLNQLQEEGYISIVKGKVSINTEQYRALSDAWDSLI